MASSWVGRAAGGRESPSEEAVLASCAAAKAGSFTVLMYSTHPRLHQSTSKPYVLRIQISGARYTGVPQKVSAVGDSFDSPKSVSLTCPAVVV